MTTQHTTGPWHWRTGENGEGGIETTLVGSPDKWVRCESFCFGWEEGSEASRGAVEVPGHEHNQAPVVLGASGWHGSGDLIIDKDGPDARLIAAAPALLEALEATLVWLQPVGAYDVQQQVRKAIANASKRAA